MNYFSGLRFKMFKLAQNSVTLISKDFLGRPIRKNMRLLISQPFSDQSNLEKYVVDFEQVKKATVNKNAMIIDVREPDEIKDYGKIPNSINIPLGNVSTALSTLSDKEFQKAYNRSKPSEDMEIIFYCMIGKRSGMAQENAYKLGYKNQKFRAVLDPFVETCFTRYPQEIMACVKNYVGSWTDWAKKMQ